MAQADPLAQCGPLQSGEPDDRWRKKRASIQTRTLPALAVSFSEVTGRAPGGGAELFCHIVSGLTDGRFQVRLFAAGEIVGTFQVADALYES